MVLANFSAHPEKVRAVVEAERLQYGHLINPAFAIEISKIEPLPHQRLAVYDRMLNQSRLRFLLADDAGAGKTIMTGLYIREMLARRLIHRILIIPPAGLVDNWQNELANLFSLRFPIRTGYDARKGNPFLETDSDRLIISLDTLRQPTMFRHLQDRRVKPYDLIVFDEAHKLSANQDVDFTVHKTDRYKLAEALTGANLDDPDESWRLSWAGRHVLLLTATPHMGKDSPYYYLWRLLLPEMLSTYDAFQALPATVRQNHFIRRTKEEMIDYDEQPIYPKRLSNTFSFDLTTGPVSEQALYDGTTHYIDQYYNQAPFLNRSAARFAIGMFQRRLASSTYALRCSFERRLNKVTDMIAQIETGSLSIQQLDVRQRQFNIEDPFESHTADEEATDSDREANEQVEEAGLEAIAAQSLEHLEAERDEVRALLTLADKVLQGNQEDSKFARLRQILEDPNYRDEKLIIFTEHKDTLTFLVNRLEQIGFYGQVAQIHGGMDYRQRAAQVAFFRQPIAEQGARYLVATDAAGEGINLQICWLMVNYDIPWNPARLEQRMGRIHRFGQQHDPVIIMNLVADKTREGQVLKTLLDKLETIREQLGSDKVFDVVGKLFAGMSMRDYIAHALTDRGAQEAAQEIARTISLERARQIEATEQQQYGPATGEVAAALPRLKENQQRERYRKLMPGYVVNFISRVAPLLGLTVNEHGDQTFTLQPTSRPLVAAMTNQRPQVRFTARRPTQQMDKTIIFLHPGEASFDRFSAYVVDQFAEAAQQGAYFVDPTTHQPYLFQVMRLTIERTVEPTHASYRYPEQIDHQLVGLKQYFDGRIERCPVEQLLLLTGAETPSLPDRPLNLAELLTNGQRYATEEIAQANLETHRHRLQATITERLQLIDDAFESEALQLIEARRRQQDRVNQGHQAAKAQVERIKQRQRNLRHRHTLAQQAITLEPQLLHIGQPILVAQALVWPTADPEIREQYQQDIEQMAMQQVIAFEEAQGGRVIDVTTPPKARQAGLTDYPGFDLLSHRPTGETRCIEVKGRATIGKIELTENEWSQACTLRGRYWLYVVYQCATPHPDLPQRIQDPFGKLLTGGVTFRPKEIYDAATETND